MNNEKLFNLHAFLSTFARNLIELFIGTILFKAGFSLKMVILYYLIVCGVSLLITPLCFKIAKKYSNRLLMIIGTIAFIAMQITLNRIYLSLWYIVLVGALYGIYRRGYWISRRFYNLKVIKKDNIASKYAIITIVNQLAIVFSAYIGALLLDFINIRLLTIISLTLFVLSVVPLYLMKFTHEHNEEKLCLFKTIKTIGFSNLHLFGTYELLNLVKFLITLYIFIYIKDTYKTVGILNVITNLATIIFSYIYGKSINNNQNFLKTSIVLTVIVLLCKINTTGIALAMISFLEGIFTKMLDISSNKNFFLLSKKFDYYNYNYAYEFFQNLYRFLLITFLYIFVPNLKVMIYISLLVYLVAICFTFKEKDVEDYDPDHK